MNDKLGYTVKEAAECLGISARIEKMPTTELVVTPGSHGAYLVHEPGRPSGEGVVVHHYERNNAWVCEVHGANHATTRLDCQHIRVVREKAPGLSRRTEL